METLFIVGLFLAHGILIANLDLDFSNKLKERDRKISSLITELEIRERDIDYLKVQVDTLYVMIIELKGK